MKPADTGLRLKDINPSTDNKAVLAACRKLLQQPYGFFYGWGGPGNAKTIILKALCNHLALKGYAPVVYIKFSRLMDIVKDAFGEKKHRAKQLEAGLVPDDWQNLGYLDRFERLRRIKVLAIEEFDKEYITAFSEKFRFDFIDERYDQAWRGETITLFASNDPPSDLPLPLQSRIEDGRFIVVENLAGDSRPDLERPDDVVVDPLEWVR